MDLRPHHLLCTQGYSGKGYSSEFVENMNQITRKLRSREPVKVRLTCSTDDLCAKCPNMLGTDLCSTNDKVKRFDRKVMEYFHLEEKEYISGACGKNQGRNDAPDALRYLRRMQLVSGQRVQGENSGGEVESRGMTASAFFR